jgi:hypothetical protein
MSNPFDEAAEAFKPEPVAKKETALAEPKERVILDVGSHDIDDETYHSDPCPEPSLSCSIAKVLINRSPRHAWAQHPRLNADFERDEKETFDLGSAFHTMILGKGAEIAVLDFPDWRTKDSKEAREAARKAGQTPMLLHQFERANAMVKAVRAQIPGHEELAYAMAAGVPERTLIWKEETSAGPIYCRLRLDWEARNGALFPDWKSTGVGAGPEEWGAKTMWQLDSHIQAAFYRRGIKAVLDKQVDLFFAVAEIEFPHALACMRPTPAAVAMAERAVEYAIQMWGRCLHSNKWPGYSRQMAWIDPPAWKERTFLEREERGELDATAAWAMLEALGKREEREDRPEVEGDPDDPFGLPPIPEETTK